MQTQTLARPNVKSAEWVSILKRYWRWAVLLLITIAPRIYLLRVFDIELSNDGFAAVTTLNILQNQGASAIPRELVDRFILHPLYMIFLGALKIATPASIDFYIAARFLSTLIACVAIFLMFDLVRRAFNEYAAWAAALLLAFAPTFLWESVAILSSSLFLALYLAVLRALVQSQYRLASLFAFLSAITRYEGTVLIALVFIALILRDARERKIHFDDWFVFLALSLAFPLTLAASGTLATGNALEFLGANSMASIWLRFLAPGDFLKRASFFITQYPVLVPLPIVWLGLAGAIIALARYRTRATMLLFIISALYILFFETLVWFNSTTLEVRFLMYPGLSLLIFAGVALATGREVLSRLAPRVIGEAALGIVLIALLALSFQQGVAGMRFIYNSYASQREMADELTHIVVPNQQTNLLVYGGTSGALDLFGRQRGLHLTFTDFRFAPDENPEQFLIDRQIQFVIYPVGNAFASAKYPYLARFETQTRNGVTFQPLTQFATSTDNQLYSIWSVSTGQ